LPLSINWQRRLTQIDQRLFGKPVFGTSTSSAMSSYQPPGNFTVNASPIFTNYNERITTMPSFHEVFRPRSLPFAMKKSTETLQEGTELSASELLDELSGTQVQSISATVVADHAEELTILLTVKKWKCETSKTVDSFTQHPDTAQTNPELVDR
jgi:hypothetical protein